MKRTGLLLVSAALAMVFAGAVVVVGQPEQAEAVTSDDLGKIVFIGPGVVSNPNPYGPDANASDIYIMNPDGTDVRRVTGESTRTLGRETEPVLSPDGRKIVFRATSVVDFSRVSHTYVINTDGSGLIMLPAYRGTSPVWSPDGSKVAFVDVVDQFNDRSYDSDIFVTNADGSGQPFRVTNTPLEHEDDLDWSPDGEKIAFTCFNCPGANGANDVYVTNADGSGTPQQLTGTTGLGEAEPRWSPDGEKIAYSRPEYSSGTYTSRLYVMNADGSGQRPLFADGSGSPGTYSWTPDGKLLFYGSYGGSSGLFKTDVDGTNVTRLSGAVWPSYGSEFPYGSEFRWGPSAAADAPPSDTSAPVLDLPQGISVQAAGPDGAPATFSATATDDVDGPVPVACASASGLASGDTFPVGTTRVGCSATDEAGNEATGGFEVSVLYDFAGFFSPVDNPEVLNRVKAGSAVPVKFSLGGDMGLDVFAEAADGSSYPKSAAMACDSTDPVDAIEQTVAAGSSGLTYDAATDRYTYVWKTQKAWTGCRQLVVKLDDGTVHRANFKLVK